MQIRLRNGEKKERSEWKKLLFAASLRINSPYCNQEERSELTRDLLSPINGL